MSVIHFQMSVWSMSEDGESDIIEGTLPTPPNLHHIVGMLVHVEHVHQAILTLIHRASHLGNEPGQLSSELEKLSVSNSQVALGSNELAASLLTVIKTAPCTTGKELSNEVQSLSHDIARAGKNLNHLLKRRRVSGKGIGRIQPQIPQLNVATRTVPVEDTEKREMVTSHQGMQGLPEQRRGEGEGHHDVLNEQSGIEDCRSTGDVGGTTSMEHDRPPNRLKVHVNSTVQISSSGLTSFSVEEGHPRPPGELKSSCHNRTLAGDHRLTADAELSKTLEPVAVTSTKYSEMSNATGQVISESPSNSPPHQTHPQNGYSAPTTVGHVSDEEDSSVI